MYKICNITRIQQSSLCLHLTRYHDFDERYLTDSGSSKGIDGPEYTHLESFLIHRMFQSFGVRDYPTEQNEDPQGRTGPLGFIHAYLVKTAMERYIEEKKLKDADQQEIMKLMDHNGLVSFTRFLRGYMLLDNKLRALPLLALPNRVATFSTSWRPIPIPTASSQQRKEDTATSSYSASKTSSQVKDTYYEQPIMPRRLFTDREVSMSSVNWAHFFIQPPMAQRLLGIQECITPDQARPKRYVTCCSNDTSPINIAVLRLATAPVT